MGGIYQSFYNGVTISVVNRDTELICDKLSAGIYIKDAAYSCVSWGVGKGAVRQAWSPGDVAFVPVHDEITAEYPDGDQAHTCIAVPPKMLLAAANDNACMSNDIHRQADQATVQLARAFTNLGDAPDPLVVDHLTMALCHRACSWFGIPAVAANDNNVARINRTIEYVQDNLEQPITIAELASTACMSDFHFARQFKIVTGRSPLKYVMQKRIEQAQRMLGVARLPIAEIALACGFSTQSHMSVAFRKHVGMSPLAFRRQAKQR